MLKKNSKPPCLGGFVRDRLLSRLIQGGSAVLGLSLAGGGFSAQTPPPNVVLILLDDLGYADLGCQGSPDIRTPHIDALAKSGVRFTSGYVPVSVCGPSRASLLTGKYSAGFGLQGNGEAVTGIPRECTTLAEYLKRGGYATQAIGKWHLGYTPDQTPMARGFDNFFGQLSGGGHFFPFSEGGAKWNAERGRTPIQRNGQELSVGDYPPETYITDLCTEEATRFITTLSKPETRNPEPGTRNSKPFFIYLAYNAPHGPIMAPDNYKLRNTHIEEGSRRIFASMMTAVDDGVGKIVDTLRRENLLENTILVLLSDNGGPTKVNTSLNTPFRGQKGDVFEGGVRVPFIISWSGTIPPAQVSDTLVSSLDILPTFLTAAGVSTEDSFDGVNILPWITGKQTGSPQRDLYFWRAGRRAIRSGDIKLTNAQLGPKSELFNIVENYQEDPDRQLQMPERQQELMRRIAQWESGWAPLLPSSGRGDD
jgi:arylsulfatase A-like enzyme